MKEYKWEIRQNATGLIQTGVESTWTHTEYISQEVVEFMWEEGNYSCDCNRYLFFYRAIGEEFDEDDIVCGHEQYDVNLYTSEGEQFYTEF